MSRSAGAWLCQLMGAYSMSKFGLEGFSDSVRRELRPHEVRARW